MEISRRTQGTGIIYTRTRKAAEQISQLLKQDGIAASAYHGGLKSSERDEVQQAWLEDRIRIIAATNAFGMGIDKPDVRFVVHYNLPFDLESYYQEAGRGGRDGKTALAIAFDNPIDRAEMNRWNLQKYPSWETLNHHYHQLCNYFQIANQGKVGGKLHLLDIKTLSKSMGVSPLLLYHSLRLLHNEGLLVFSEDSDDYGYIQITARPGDVMQYKQQHPRQAEFIDYILRRLGGESYTREVRFLPVHWARSRGISEEELNKTLGRLAQHRIISWRAPVSQPSIRFLVPRHPLTRKELNWEKYTFLRKQADFRLKQIQAYAEEQHLCRSLTIQGYFGEKSKEPCGKCDVCIGRHRTKVSDGEFSTIRKAILDFVDKQPCSYRDAVLRIPTGTPAQREKVLRYLLDKQMINVGPAGNLELK